jgi:hypothetical protein
MRFARADRYTRHWRVGDVDWHAGFLREQLVEVS